MQGTDRRRDGKEPAPQFLILHEDPVSFRSDQQDTLPGPKQGRNPAVRQDDPFRDKVPVGKDLNPVGNADEQGIPFVQKDWIAPAISAQPERIQPDGRDREIQERVVGKDGIEMGAVFRFQPVPGQGALAEFGIVTVEAIDAAARMEPDGPVLILVDGIDGRVSQIFQTRRDMEGVSPGGDDGQAKDGEEDKAAFHQAKDRRNERNCKIK